MKKTILAAVTIAAVFLIIGLILGYSMAPDAPPPEIIRETETVTRWIKQPSNCDEYRYCEESPLNITGAMSGSWLRVRCADACREAEKGFELECRPDRPKNYVGVAALAIYTDGRVKILVGGEYMRNVAGPVMVGGGAYSNGTDHAARVNAGATW